ncbi:MAG: hypothetical protein ACTIKQ_06710 [Microbacterium sp.]
MPTDTPFCSASFVRGRVVQGGVRTLTAVPPEDVLWQMFGARGRDLGFNPDIAGIVGVVVEDQVVLMLAEPSFKSASAKGAARDSGPWDVHAEGVKGEETDVARCDHMRWDGVPRPRTAMVAHSETGHEPTKLLGPDQRRTGLINCVRERICCFEKRRYSGK